MIGFPLSDSISLFLGFWNFTTICLGIVIFSCILLYTWKSVILKISLISMKKNSLLFFLTISYPFIFCGYQPHFKFLRLLFSLIIYFPHSILFLFYECNIVSNISNFLREFSKIIFVPWITFVCFRVRFLVYLSWSFVLRAV